MSHLTDENGSPAVLEFDKMPHLAKKSLAYATFRALDKFMLRPDAQSILDAAEERLREENSSLVRLL